VLELEKSEDTILSGMVITEWINFRHGSFGHYSKQNLDLEEWSWILHLWGLLATWQITWVFLGSFSVYLLRSRLR
jgi:hypothetical protein